MLLFASFVGKGFSAFIEIGYDIILMNYDILNEHKCLRFPAGVQEI